MADETRISVASRQLPNRILEKLRREMHKIAQSKSWDNDTKKKFEGKLLELYKDTVEDSVKRNVAVENPSTVDSEEKEAKKKAEKKKRLELIEMWTEVEELIRSTTSKRKVYPPKVVAAIDTMLRSKVQVVEEYHPSIRSEPLPSSSSVSEKDVDEFTSALTTAGHDLSSLSKDFPQLKGKLEAMLEAIRLQKGMETRETDAIVFGADTPRRSYRTKTTTPMNKSIRTSEIYSLRSTGKREHNQTLSKKSLSSQFKRKK
ncbi:kinetochore-associated protein NSL1 homolog [Nematostella vectensis]|uniref:kinetochore-associated protein NSL1 homolog n=1 Tax=Nematostella vectensis TaxID=45351 RepID=UPI002076FA27|nr:kinetochore-associated protein NSL1 homolog [Nematostella vectensis]